ncbi:MAG TPA: transglutaminase family protein [Rhodocyclaceae bacterium]|nr:transglutaminase family protein [Rhodocyclaceae bacterium]HMY48962.1 transglutaminase family protein [Rhodocyclaceae bacterium]HMZ75681.1 transglutaminase family protein [Rhodocyclaceae bacterium]HNE14457.1 transglutaminase family protein [Rhodocyclaceae bacterium]HNO88443.1 transglutaminase family protein [Rhodocyclaceae bacterium]
MTRSARYIVLHETEYTPCGVPVSLAQHLLHLMPRALPWQTVEKAELTVDPDLARIQQGEDVFGNPVAWMALDTPHDGLLVRAESRVTVLGRTLPKAEESPSWESVREIFHYHSGARDADSLDAQRYLYSSPRAPRDARLAAFAALAFKPETPLLAGVQALMEIIYKTFTFDAKATEVSTPVFEVLERRRGVCQDFAHLMIAALRSVGLPARYMSGYLLTDPPPGKPRLVGADASHAWLAVWCPENGWVEYDPTNGIQPDLRHVTLGWGRDFQDVSPLRGVILGGQAQAPEVRVTVMPVDEWEARQARAVRSKAPAP